MFVQSHAVTSVHYVQVGVKSVSGHLTLLLKDPPGSKSDLIVRQWVEREKEREREREREVKMTRR